MPVRGRMADNMSGSVSTLRPICMAQIKHALPPALRPYSQILCVVDWHRLQDPSTFAGWSVLDLSMEGVIRAQLQRDERFG